MKFNTSKAAKSRLVAPITSTKPAKDTNMPKKVPSGTTFQSSRITNHSRLNEAKSTIGAKISSVSTNKPTKTFGYSGVSSANQGAVPRIPKSNNKDPAAKKTPDVRNGVKINGNSQKTKSQESSLPKPNFAKQPAKPVSRTGIPAYSSTSSKGIPVQKTQNRLLQKPASSISNKPLSAPTSKPHEKTTPSLMGNVPTKKKECFSKMASNKQADIKKSDDLNFVRKTGEKNKCVIDAESHEVESLFEQSMENIPDIFSCDVSVIGQPSVIRRPSFAPADFKFRPPAGLHEFTFDDVFEEGETKFVSRTSTPSKPCKNSSSPLCKEIQVEREIVKDLNEVSKNAAIEEKLIKESDVKVVVDSTDKDENLPTERENKTAINEHPILDSIDSPLDTFDTNKIKEIIAKQIALMNLDEEEFNDGERSLIRAEKEIDNDFNTVSKNSSIAEKLQKESGVKIVIDCINEDENLPSERENEPAINELSTLDDSQLDCIDETKIKEIIARQLELMKLEEDELNDVFSLKEQDPDKCTEKKRLSAPKRASMLKNIPVLNSIAETSETDESTTQTPSKSTENKQNFGATPRRSQRLSKLVIMEDSPISCLTVTPRRSTRLQNIASKKFLFEQKQIFSPVDECKLKTIPRRSMRLIDLNTPEKEINSPGKSNLTTDFQKLSLMDTENVNPQALIDLDYSPDPVPRSRSKKISLLYSPEKIRKSMRKSIRGDLMSFSPSN